MKPWTFPSRLTRSASWALCVCLALVTLILTLSSPMGAEYLSIMLTSLACAGLLVHSSPSIRPLPPHPSSPLPFPSLPAASAALHAASLLEPRRKKARK